MTWREAFHAGPGPRSAREALILALKGVCMGSADIVPGVSGGTVALITGIYEDLLAAIKSVNARMIRRLAVLDLKGALVELHLRFLLPLALGIGVAIVSLSRLINYLIHHHPVPTWSLFFGLIAASVWVVGRTVESWTPLAAVLLTTGVAAGYLVVDLVPATTPETLGFVFLSGMVAICAMILPGISGAFILLILGKYEFITATLKDPLVLANLEIIAVFAAGCGLGLAGFARALKYLLEQYHGATLAFLTGLMAGSLRKIWPFKETLETAVAGGKEVIIRQQNILPDAFTGQAAAALVFMVVGFAAVLVLERLTAGTRSKT